MSKEGAKVSKFPMAALHEPETAGPSLLTLFIQSSPFANEAGDAKQASDRPLTPENSPYSVLQGAQYELLDGSQFG